MFRIRSQQTFEGLLVDWFIEQPPAGMRLPVALLSREQKAAELQRVVAAEAMTAAYKAELILGLADDSPDAADPPAGTPGAKRGSWAADGELPGVSEFFTAELSAVLNCGRGTANHLAVRAWTYRANLPGTWAALAAGTLDEPRAKVLADVLGHTSPALARSIEAALLPEAARLSLGRLRARAMALLLDHDAEAVNRRRTQAQRSADVRHYPSHLDGMGTLSADLPAPVGAACYDMVDRLAAMLKADGDPRPIGELRAAVLADLIQRPWDTSRPAVTAHLSISANLAALAGRSTQAGEVNGLPITAAHLRELLAQLGALGTGGLRAPNGGGLTLALTDPDGRLLATVTAEQLAALARRGCREHPAGDCGCPLLDRPPPVQEYQPSRPQRRWVKTRDRTCRFPNCGQRVGWADLDHVIAHACGGQTDCTNLCCLCRSHHRLKTHAPGWHFQMSPDGVLSVTTPSGITRTTRPPGLQPAAESEPEPPDPPAVPPAPPPADDPPPF